MKSTVIVLAGMIVTILLLASSHSQVPHLLDFQGRLTDPATSTSLPGPVDMTFRLFSLAKLPAVGQGIGKAPIAVFDNGFCFLEILIKMVTKKIFKDAACDTDPDISIRDRSPFDHQWPHLSGMVHAKILIESRQCSPPHILASIRNELLTKL